MNPTSFGPGGHAAQSVPPTPPPHGTPLPPGAPGPYALPYATANLFPYASARPRARVVIALAWAMIVTQVLLIWPSIADIGELQRLVGGGLPADEITGAQIFMLIVGLIGLVVTILYIIFWMMWVHRTYRNLTPLGATGLHYSPGWAVGYYFIPILNLFRPYQVMHETWRASDPRHGGGTNWVMLAAPALIGWWWALHVISMIVNQISFRVGLRSDDPNVLLAAAWGRPVYARVRHDPAAGGDPDRQRADRPARRARGDGRDGACGDGGVCGGRGAMTIPYALEQ